MLDGSVPEPGGWNRFVFEVDDIEAVVASMRQAGIHVAPRPAMRLTDKARRGSIPAVVNREET